MKASYCLLLTILMSGSVVADPGYFRHPSLHENTLVFTAEGDVWRMPLNAQGAATRLTTHPAEEHSAVISPDGSQVAFAANYEGTTEVYVMPVDGGLARRVTFENSSLRLHQWDKSGHIVYATNSRVGPTGSWILKRVEPATLNVETIPLSDAVEGVVDEKAKEVFFTQFGLQVSTDNANQYNGGAKGELWRFQLGSKREASKLTADHDGSVRTPMLANNTLYFVSNQSGLDNLWSMSLNGKNLKQITQFSDWAVRDPMLDGDRIVFQHGADLKLLQLTDNSVATLPIKLTSDYPNLRDKWVNKPLKYLNSARFNEEQKKVVLTARGKVAVAGTTDARLVEIATDPTSRTRNAVLSHDGKWVYALNDSSGEMEIWRYAANGSDDAKQLTNDGKVFRWNLYLSPDGKWLAHDDKAGNVWLLELESGDNKRIIDDNTGLSELASLTWSSDSQHIAVTYNKRNSERRAVLLYSLGEEKEQVLTSQKYESFSPTFSPDGKWLYFLSNRNFRATPGAPWGDRNLGPVFDRRTEIFALSLTDDASFPFEQPNELKNPKSDPNSKKDSSEEADEDAGIKIGWDGLNSRLWQVPVASGNYSKLSMNKNYLYVIDNVSEPNSKPSLKSIGIKPKAKVETFTDSVEDYQLGRDGKSMFVHKQGGGNSNLFIVPAKAKFPKTGNDTKVKSSAWKLRITPQQEWAMIFKDAWLMHRDSLFDANMRGTNWNDVKSKYLPLLNRVTDRHELNDIFKQMMGELNTLHSQVRGGDTSNDPNAPRAASLGATFEETKNGLRISHIYRHDVEIPKQASPLNSPGVDAKITDVITHVNGQAVSNKASLVKLLRNQAGKQVLLTLQRGGNSHQTIVKPVSASRDFRLRYQDWVHRNADIVNEENQNIGYLHLYAMGSNDIATFAKEFYAQYKKPGLIIDVRRNRGGNIDAWVLEKLLKRTWMFWQTTNGETFTNMQQTFRGHLVVLADEFTYSDGETFTAGIKALGLGTVIGKQTAGAGVWLSGRNRVVDGGIARVAEYPVFAMDGSWIVEGTGVKPDIEVNNMPNATFNGEDAQLAAAIEYLQKKMKNEPTKGLKAAPLPNSTAPANAGK